MVDRAGVLLDVDGTLLDTNHLHALAWWRAFRRHDRTFPLWRVHRLIGMGGDQLVTELAGEEVDGVEDTYREEFDQLADETTLLPGARRLAEALHDAGLAVVLASSSEAEVLDRFRSVLDIDRWLTGWTSAGDVDRSKPDGEIFDVAVERFGLDRRRTVAIGDTVWDGHAARRAGVGFVAVASGGSAPGDLRRAGASRCYDDVDQVASDLHRGPLAVLLGSG